MRRLLWIIDDGLWMILDDSWMIFDDYCAFSEFYLTRSLCGFNHENHWRIFVTFFVWILGLSPIVGHKKNLWQLWLRKWFQFNARVEHLGYPLVNVYVTMENHHFQLENPL
jgi:hypothetical protein